MSNIIRVGGGGGSTPTPTLITKSITENGTYLAQDDNADGYSEVEVDVEGETRTVFSTVKLYSGKITNTTGVVVEDSNYMYTDYLPLPEGDGTWYGVTFDLGLNSSQTYAGLTMYNDDKSYNNYWNPNARFRFVDTRTQYAQGARWFRLSFPVANLKYVTAHSWGDGIVYCADTPTWVTNEVENIQYVDISDFAHYYRKNTSTPTVTPISSTEVSLTYQDQNNTGYELSSYSVSLEKGIYVAEIYATIDKNNIQSQYTWGIYSCNSTSWATVNSNAPMDNEGIDTYVPFDRSDTNEHYYEVPIKMLADGTAYICFATAGDGGINATITVRSLKIRKAYGSEGNGGGIDYLESWIINSKSAVNIPTTTTHLVYTNGEISAFENADNAGNETVTLGDISTFIGDASGFYWWVTANANMTYRIYNVLTGTLGELQTATSGTRIISDGTIDTNYCMEIRRYS